MRNVRSLLGDQVTDLTATRKRVAVTMFDPGEALRDYVEERYGPTIAAFKDLGDDAENVAALDRDLVTCFGVSTQGLATWNGNTCWLPRKQASPFTG